MISQFQIAVMSIQRKIWKNIQQQHWFIRFVSIGHDQLVCVSESFLGCTLDRSVIVKVINCQIKKKGGKEYWVSQQVWNQLRNVCERSEHRLQKKIVFRSKKLLFQPFLKTAKIENGFLSKFSPISNNLLNKSLHKIMEKSCFKKPLSILQLRK